MPRFSFVPRGERFFDLFEESARNVVHAAQVLKQLVDTWEHVEASVAELTEIEHRGDTITHQIIALLNRAFITPFDREDISLLARSLDDVVDFIDSASDAMLLYKVSPPGVRAKELADIIVQGAVEVERAVPMLRSHSELKNILPRCVEINRLENMADRVYRSALAELFDDTSDLALLIKWREIYEHMETATDRCEDVADVLEGVALKHA
jgi:predicted phosphate transport protein (TIGR00153 family)